MLKTKDIHKGHTYANGGTWRQVEFIGPRTHQPPMLDRLAVKYRTVKGPGRGSTGVMWLDNFCHWARREVSAEELQ